MTARMKGSPRRGRKSQRRRRRRREASFLEEIDDGADEGIPTKRGRGLLIQKAHNVAGVFAKQIQSAILTIISHSVCLCVCVCVCHIFLQYTNFSFSFSLSLTIFSAGVCVCV